MNATTRTEQLHTFPAQIAGDNRAHSIDLSNQLDEGLSPAICASANRPLDTDLSSDLDWTIAAIEKEQALPQPSAIRLRYLRAIKAQLEQAI